MKAYYRSMILALIALFLGAFGAVELVKNVYAQHVVHIDVFQGKQIDRAECSQGVVPGQGKDKGRDIYIGCAVYLKK